MPAPRTTPSPVRKKATSRKAAPLTHERVAERLHQGPCQSITGVRLLLNVIARALPPEATQMRQQLQTVDTALKDSGIELRALITELRTAPEKDASA